MKNLRIIENLKGLVNLTLKINKRKNIWVNIKIYKEYLPCI